VRADREKLLQLANLIDLDLTARAPQPFSLPFSFRGRFLSERLGLDDPEIRMVPLLEPVTGPARTTGKPVGTRGLAQQRLRKDARQAALSEPGMAVDEQRVRKGAPSPAEFVPRPS
jgi:hypothetical protein